MQVAVDSIFGPSFSYSDTLMQFSYFKQIPSYSLSFLLEGFCYKLLRPSVQPSLSCFCKLIHFRSGSLEVSWLQFWHNLSYTNAYCTWARESCLFLLETGTDLSTLLWCPRVYFALCTAKFSCLVELLIF